MNGNNWCVTQKKRNLIKSIITPSTYTLEGPTSTNVRLFGHNRTMCLKSTKLTFVYTTRSKRTEVGRSKFSVYTHFVYLAGWFMYIINFELEYNKNNICVYTVTHMLHVKGNFQEIINEIIWEKLFLNK